MLNLKVRCIKSIDTKLFIVGDIYNIVDGVLTARSGHKTYHYSNLSDLNNSLFSQFELVEEDLHDKILEKIKIGKHKLRYAENTYRFKVVNHWLDASQRKFLKDIGIESVNNSNVSSAQFILYWKD